ncbi:MAG TPA: hypothetical protein VIK08_03300 [Candidatus Limnocylindrales bacterium]
MTADLANTLVVAAAVGALVCVALGALIASVALLRVSRDVRRVARSLNDVTAALSSDLPATLNELRQTSVNLNRVSQELAPRLTRVDALLDEADATVASLRATVETAEDIVRGPAAAMDRARRGVGAVGGGLARGADRLVRSVQERTGRRE